MGEILTNGEKKWGVWDRVGLVGGGGSGYEGVDKIDYRGVQEIQTSKIREK